MAITVEMRTQVSQLYVALFGRAPDAEGLGFWVQKLDGGMSLNDMANTMYATTPARAYYPEFLTNQEIIASFYLNVLGRPADAEGLAFWTAKLNASGAPGPVINEMIAVVANYTALGGSDPDGLVSEALFNNKVAVAQWYGEQGGNIAGSTAILSTVTSDPATVDAIINPENPLGQGETFVLTAGMDNLVIATANTVDTVNGVVDGSTPANSTFSIGDVIEGNNNTILRLAVADDGTAAYATVKSVDQVNFIAGVGGTLDVDAVGWTGIGSVNMVSGVDGLNVRVDNLHVGAGLSVGAGLAGDLNVSYANGVDAYMASDRGSSISYMNGVVVGSVDAGGTAAMLLTATANTNVAMTVGDVTIAGAEGASGYFSMWNQGKAGDMTVGNVSITGNSDSWVGIGNWSQTASNPASNVTVGDITVHASNTGTWAGWIGVYNTGDNSAKTLGNLTVGNVSLELSGKNAYGDITLSIDDGVGTNGNLTAGNITAKATGVSSSIDVWIENNANSTGANNAKVGDVTLGDVTLDIAKSASITFSINQYANAAGTGTATAGNFVMGDMDVNVGKSGWFYASIEAPSAYAAGNAATVGNVTVGNRTITLAGDASMSMTAYWGYAYANGGKAGTVGNVVLGDLNVTVGINADASFDEYIDAYGSAASKIGNVTLGAVNFNVDDGGSVSYDLSVDSDGTIGDISLGALTMHANVSADAYAYFDFSADKGMGNVTVGAVTMTGNVNASMSVTHDFSVDNGSIGNMSFGNLTMVGAKDSWLYYYNDVDADMNIGNVTIGNVSLTAGEGASVEASHSFSAWNGAIGAVTVGDINVSAAKNATASYYLDIEAEIAIGNVAIGNVNIAAAGASAYASVSIDIENDGIGKIGTITVGDVVMSAKGEWATAEFYLSASSADVIGAMTVGNLDLSVGNDAKKTGANIDVEIGNWSGDSASSVTVGNINLTGTTVRGTSDTTMTYTADVSIWSENGNVTVGNITVAGGDGKADNFATLTNWFSASSSNGTVTVGTISYSGYGAAATIDITGFNTVAGVIGSAFADTITVGKQAATQVTGGAGADTFEIVTAYNAKTLATVHKILDFSNAQGDKIDVGVTPSVASYGEASYASFDAFWTSASAAGKDVYVGLVGSDAFVAIDHNGGGVDSVIMLVGLSSLGNIDVASFI